MLEDSERVLLNARAATTEDLLDRVTIFRYELEPEALPILERELWQRGVNEAQIEAHAEQCQKEWLLQEDGTPARCSYCFLHAAAEGRSWFRVWRLIPIFPRHIYYCKDHRP